MIVHVRAGRKFIGDQFIDIGDYRCPSFAVLEAAIGPGQAPELWEYLDWARAEVRNPQPSYICQDESHATRIGMALMAALEYLDPELLGLHRFTKERLETVTGSSMPEHLR